MEGLKNLSFENVIDLLKLGLELLVGGEEGDTVESCTGGILGKEFFGRPIFTVKIPVIGVSACDLAGFLQVVVDAVDSLVSDCVVPDGESSEESCDGTFQVSVHLACDSTPFLSISQSWRYPLFNFSGTGSETFFSSAR